MSIIDKTLSVIAPHCCRLCGDEGNIICNSCSLSLPTLPSICYACGKASRSYKPCRQHIGAKKPQRVFMHSDYAGEVKALLNDYKFNYKRAASLDIARIIDDILPYYANPPLICFVPTIGRHVRERSFDHSKLLAKELAKRRQWHYATLLVKTKNVQQKGATRLERRKQLKGTIRATNSLLIKESHILLIDDVVTTGATIEACTEVLLKAGASGVDVAVLARTP